MQQRIALPKRLHTLNQVLLLLLLLWLLPLIVRCTSTALRTTAGSDLGATSHANIRTRGGKANSHL